MLGAVAGIAAQALARDVPAGIVDQLFIVRARARARTLGRAGIGSLGQPVVAIIGVAGPVALGVGDRRGKAIVGVGPGDDVRLHAGHAVAGLDLGGAVVRVIGIFRDTIGTVAPRG